jgi:DNA modification methylase
LDQVKLGEIKLRRHTRRQINKLSKNIDRFGFLVPVIVDANGVLITGHGRIEAARQLGLARVPAIRATHLTTEELRAFAIADNRLAELSDWDRDVLKSELGFLVSLDFDLDMDLTGFEMPEIEIILADGEDQAVEDADDDPVPLGAQPVTRLGDVWVSTDGTTTIVCGDSRSEETYRLLLGEEQADVIVTDPPYNLAINGFVSGNGKAQRREFHEASGEMSDAEFRLFLTDILRLYGQFGKDGSLHYVFMDWRNIDLLIGVGRDVYQAFVNLGVWRKTTGGMGGLYRSAHELCAIFKKGDGPHINNVQLGRFGRNRSNVWTHQGANTFRKGRDADLAAHPTVKPVELIKDIITDASHLNGLVLDAFLGSGTTLLAARRTGRRGAGIEIDPLYVDISIRRIQQATGAKFVLRETGEAFDDRAARVEAGQ